jgi:galactokinase
LALAISAQLLRGNGASRVHGGGFAGTIQAFIPNHMVNEYISGMENVFGKGACLRVNIRPVGITRLPIPE